MSGKYVLTRLVCSHFLVCLVTLVWPSVSPAALNAYMTVTAESQGEIEGSVVLQGREDTIEIVGFGYSVVAPRDAASGLPTGKRRHNPVRVLKAIDRSSPLLFQAMVTNENLTSVVIRFNRQERSGSEEQYYTVTLTNASIDGIMPIHSSADAESARVPMRESISFTFQTISVE